MDFLKELTLLESEKIASRETQHVIDVVNAVYSEWKKTGRRKNAVDLITSSTNKFANIHPSFVSKVHEATRLKMATILMRCMDIQSWKPIDTKEKIYRRLYPLIKELETYNPNTGTGGLLRDIIHTRLSATFTQEDAVFVAYEPVIPADYLRFIFGSKLPEKTYKMTALPLPDDFEQLVKVLRANHEKAVARYKSGN
jgi:hypothetical protein